jgi:hypothetical protein
MAACLFPPMAARLGARLARDWRRDGRDVFALAQAADGTVLAGTSHGIFA